MHEHMSSAVQLQLQAGTSHSHWQHEPAALLSVSCRQHSSLPFVHWDGNSNCTVDANIQGYCPGSSMRGKNLVQAPKCHDIHGPKAKETACILKGNYSSAGDCIE